MVLFLVCALWLTACQDEPEHVEVPFLVQALDEGLIIKVDQSNVATVDGEIFGVVDGLVISQSKAALVECPPAPFDPVTYWWVCQMNHPKGHAIAKNIAEPTLEDFHVYEESPSEEYPTDMTFSILFSQKPEHYPNHAAGPVAALRGLVTAWSVKWGNARVARCNSPVWAPYCQQE